VVLTATVRSLAFRLSKLSPLFLAAHSTHLPTITTTCTRVGRRSSNGFHITKIGGASDRQTHKQKHGGGAAGIQSDRCPAVSATEFSTDDERMMFTAIDVQWRF